MQSRRFGNVWFAAIGILIVTGIRVYSDEGFTWLGVETLHNQHARVFLNNGAVLSGPAKLYVEKTDRGPVLPHLPPDYKIAVRTKAVSKIADLVMLNLEGRKIRPFETDSIIINALTGVPFQDTLWLFPIINGEITAYNTKPLWQSEEYTHISKNGGEILPYSHELLVNYLYDNKYALSLFTSFRNKKSKILINYHPERAIREYNFQTTTKEFKVEKLLQLLKNEKEPEKRIQYCKEIVSIDSSVSEPYMELGDYAVKNNNPEEAYFYYTQFMRYCNNTILMNRARKKVKKLNKPSVY